MNTDALIGLVAFTILTLLWLVFGAALLLNRRLLQDAWSRFRGWSLVFQLVVWLLALPVVLGLWIWQTRWPAWLRLVLVAGLAWMTLYTFFPRLLLI